MRRPDDFIALCLLLLWSALAYSQPEYNHVDYRDTTIVNGRDTVHVICGANPALHLRFWSRDTYDMLAHDDGIHKTPVRELSAYTGEGYMDGATDTASWMTYVYRPAGISFRYPPGFLVRIDSVETYGEYELILGVPYTSTASGDTTEEFQRCIRLAFTSMTFTEEASFRSWDTVKVGCWKAVSGNAWSLGEDSDTDMERAAYLEGQNWKGLYGHEFIQGRIESEVFFAMVQGSPGKRSVVVDFLDDPPEGFGIDLFDNDICTLLSSVRFQ